MDEQFARMMQFIQSMKNEEALPPRGGYGCQDMLTAMRPMLPPRKQRMIDLMVKAMEMQMILEELRGCDE